MKILIPMLRDLILIVLVWYPLWLLAMEWSTRKDRVPTGNGIDTAKLLIVEHQLVTITNAMRQQLGVRALDRRPLLEDLEGRSWEMLRLNSRQIAEEGVRRMSWIGS
jgi:hypothetical protein